MEKCFKLNAAKKFFDILSGSELLKCSSGHVTELSTGSLRFNNGNRMTTSKINDLIG